MRLLVTFHSVSAALMLEQAMKAEAGSCALVPVPRSLSSSCGYALLAADAAEDSLLALLQAWEIEWAGLYRCQGPPEAERYTLLHARA